MRMNFVLFPNLRNGAWSPNWAHCVFGHSRVVNDSFI